MDAFDLNKQALRAEQRTRTLKAITIACALVATWIAIPVVLGFRAPSAASYLEQGLYFVCFTIGLLIITKPSWRLSKTQAFGFVLLAALIPFATTSSWLYEPPNSKAGLTCAIFIGGVGLLACLVSRFIMRGNLRRFGFAPIILNVSCVIAVAAGLAAYCEVDSARHLACHSAGIIAVVLLVYAISKQEQVFKAIGSKTESAPTED